MYRYRYRFKKTTQVLRQVGKIFALLATGVAGWGLIERVLGMCEKWAACVRPSVPPKSLRGNNAPVPFSCRDRGNNYWLTTVTLYIEVGLFVNRWRENNEKVETFFVNKFTTKNNHLSCFSWEGHGEGGFGTSGKCGLWSAQGSTASWESISEIVPAPKWCLSKIQSYKGQWNLHSTIFDWFWGFYLLCVGILALNLLWALMVWCKNDPVSRS